MWIKKLHPFEVFMVKGSFRLYGTEKDGVSQKFYSSYASKVSFGYSKGAKMSLEVKPSTLEQAVLHTKLKPCIVE